MTWRGPQKKPSFLLRPLVGVCVRIFCCFDPVLQQQDRTTGSNKLLSDQIGYLGYFYLFIFLILFIYFLNLSKETHHHPKTTPCFCHCLVRPGFVGFKLSWDQISTL